MFKDYLDHTCDIFHVAGVSNSPGYGLPSGQQFEYGADPAAVDVPCHFHLKDSGSLTQRAPQADLMERIKVDFLPGVDLRLNDKVVWKQTGLTYYAEVPRNVRDHHVTVYVQRYGNKAAL